MIRGTLLLLLLAVVSGNSSHAKPSSCEADKRLFGKWRTAVRETQLGRGYDEIEYLCNCTSRHRMILIDAKMTLRNRGTFSTSSDLLTESVDTRKVISRFWFDGEVLVQKEMPEWGNDIFKFTRVKKYSCS